MEKDESLRNLERDADSDQRWPVPEWGDQTKLPIPDEGKKEND